MPRYLVQTFGCQMNVHDSRRIEEVLEGAGWSSTDEMALADLVLFNTCSVREKAEHKLLSVLGTTRLLKEERPELVIAVAGCVAQQEGDKLLRRAPFLDLVVGPDNIPELPALVEHVRSGGAPLARTVFDVDAPAFLVAAPRPLGRGAREVTSFVTVMKGCDERCTFCIVPTTRGPERYRKSDEIVAEVALMAAGGVREVTLLGQTVNSWHEPGEPGSEGVETSRGASAAQVPLREESRFAELLRRIAREVPALARLRYTSPHPRHLTDALIRAHAELPLLPAHVHLPVQSGSNRMLKRMLRRYSRELYVERTSLLRAARPGLTLSTDFIVGFPGETREDFEETLSLVREVGFSAAFAFTYSPRPHTPALKLEDDVAPEVKDERLARLFEVVAEGQSAHLRSLVGTRATVLVEDESRVKSGDGRTATAEPSATPVVRWRGRSERHEIVHVDAPADRDLTGLLLDVTIEHANAHSLLGRLDPRTEALPLRAASNAATAGRAASRGRLPVLGQREATGESTS